jgi:hypothetical protein
MNIIVNDRTPFPHLALLLTVMAAISVILLRWAKTTGMVVAECPVASPGCCWRWGGRRRESHRLAWLWEQP